MVGLEATDNTNHYELVKQFFAARSEEAHLTNVVNSEMSMDFELGHIYIH